MADIRKELAEGIELKSSKAKEKLTEEVLASIQGAGWAVATEVDASSKEWQDALFETYVVWRIPGQPDIWCTVQSHTYSGDTFMVFDLYNPADGYIYYDVPASQVLVPTAD